MLEGMLKDLKKESKELKTRYLDLDQKEEKNAENELDLKSIERSWMEDGEDTEGMSSPSGQYSIDYKGIDKLSRKEKRTAEEIARNLLGKFRLDLEWVPCKTHISEMFKKKERYDLCMVKGFVLLRDKGYCRVCGEKVRGQTWKIAKETKEVRWQEDNCFLLCGNCGLCFQNKDYGDRSRVERFQSMRIFTLKRRRRGVRGCDSLKDYGLQILWALEKDRGGSLKMNRSVLEGLKKMPGRRLT